MQRGGLFVVVEDAGGRHVSFRGSEIRELRGSSAKSAAMTFCTTA